MPLPRPTSRAARLVAPAVLLAGLVPALVPASASATSSTASALNVTRVTPADLGYDRIGVRRGGAWRLRDSLDGGSARTYAEETPGWQPVAGDLDGDGTDAVSLFRDGVWRLRDREGGPVRTVRFGQKGDRPVVGDWDGDGVDTLGLYRGGRWFLRSTNAATAVSRTFGFGVGGDVPVVGDWDGDGDTDLAVRRGTVWYQRDSATGGLSSRHFVFGQSADLPVAGDWDHDGKDTPGLFRSGTWFFASGSGFGGYQTTAFGAAGDRPVVRRVQGLAPGVSHAVLRAGTSVAHVATVALSAVSSPDVVLSGGTLGGLERTSSMGRRTGAVLAVNGDYFLSSGRPVHALAVDGRLVQTPQLLGRAFSLDAAGTTVRMGFPDTRVVLTPSATSTTLTRWNAGGPSDTTPLVGYTSPGAGLEVPPADRCWAGGTIGGRVSRTDGGVDSLLTVSGTRCYGPAPAVPVGGTLLAAWPGSAGDAFLAGLPAGATVPMTSYLGFPGAVDVLGGNPLLLVDGQRRSADLVGVGDYFARQPRTAVGVTADGRMLVVVVDGRQPGYSTGMTLGELADLMTSLGARDAVNLDGGGSSTMYLNGIVADRPSDGHERGVGTSLVVLPGADPGQADLGTATGGGAAAARPRLTGRAPVPAEPAAADLVDPAVGWGEAARDPGSVGGLADALARQGTPLPTDLARADAAYDRERQQQQQQGAAR